jgi:tRNA nucleotidyltransferase (CCA-adding enzyme)
MLWPKIVETQQIIDPYHGLEDLKQKKLRHVTEAFQEDPVSILRVAQICRALS